MRITHIYLDMDGVLCDFVGAALRVHRQLDALDHWPAGEWDIAKVLRVKSEEFWWRIDHHGERFWASLQPYPWAADLVRLLESMSVPITIASSLSYDPYSAAGKLQWLSEHFPQFKRRYLLGSEKHLLAKPGAVLIDDNDQGVEDFRQAGGQAVLFPQAWNRRFDVKDQDKLSCVVNGLSKIIGEASCKYQDANS